MAYQGDQLIKPQTRNDTLGWPTYKVPNLKWHIRVANWCSPKQGMAQQDDQLIKSQTRNDTSEWPTYQVPNKEWHISVTNL